MNRFDIVLRDKGFMGEASYSYNSIKSALKGMLGLNEDKYYIRDNSTNMNLCYTFKDFIDTFVIEEEIKKDSYIEKIDWMKANGWSFDPEDLYDGDIAFYKDNGYCWSRRDIEDFSLEDIKKYKAWYDGYISINDMRKLFPNVKFFFDD